MTSAKRNGVSIGAALRASNMRPSGFDYLRLILALSVVVVHCVPTSYGEAQAILLRESFARPFVLAIVPMFFALSGFLVAGSMERSQTLIKFLGLRVIRIYPALVVEVVLSAFLIGPFLTKVNIETYFTDPQFFKYLVNVTGHISYFLPGVFTDNPVPRIVNLQLWTVPYELYCYIALAILMALGCKRHSIVALLGTAIFLLVTIFLYVIEMGIHPDLIRATSTLVGSFLVGVLLYVYREKIPFSAIFVVSAAIISIALLSFASDGVLWSTVPLAYLTVAIGLANPERHPFIRSADYSYGIYLYGYVVQQTVMALFPAAREWYWNLLICLPLTVVIAAASWHFVEKPAAGLKFYVDALERWWLQQSGPANQRLPNPKN